MITSATTNESFGERKIRYAVVGLGHIAQNAVLPEFRHAKENSQLTAIVSGDAEKRKELAKRYKLKHSYSHEEFDECLGSGEIDAVFIALPNDMHCEYAVRSAEAGIHVLCEKPMAVTEQECDKMIHAAAGVRLMIAYRLHFDEANLDAIEQVNSGVLGEPRLFNSVFSMMVKPGDIRLQRDHGGGTLYDIGVYCINASRYLFRSEPIEVTAMSERGGDPRFAEVDEITSAVLRFPGGRLATFTSSFGGADVSMYEVVGTEGSLRMEPAYGYQQKLVQHLTNDGKTRKKSFPKRGQFAGEIKYFSQCILEGRDPEPSGYEGLADVRIIEALYQSANSGQSVSLDPVPQLKRPTIGQQISKPPVEKPVLVNATSPRE